VRLTATFTDQFKPRNVLPHLETCLLGKECKPLLIAHLATGNLYGVIEKILVNVQRFKELMPRVSQEFYVMFQGRLALELGEAGAKLSYLRPVRMRYFWQVWHARLLLTRLLKKSSCKMVLFHSLWTYSLFASKVRQFGKKVGLWLHDVVHSGSFLSKSLYKVVPDLVIANSRYTAKSVPGDLKIEDCTVVYPMIPDNELGLVQKAEICAKVRQVLGCPASRKVILDAARFDPYKGHQLLFDALTNLPRQLDWECWIAGEAQNPTEEALVVRLKKKAIQCGFESRIRWLGHQKNLPELFAAADVYCQPNTGPEPFGMVFVEAQLAGCPVVTSAMGGSIEAVEPRYPNRFLGKPCPNSLASILSESLLNDVGSIGR